MSIGDDRPKLLVVESLEITTALDPYLSIAALAKYASLAPNWLREKLRDPIHPLPH
jgi:hypothetical protein